MNKARASVIVVFVVAYVALSFQIGDQPTVDEKPLGSFQLAPHFEGWFDESGGVWQGSVMLYAANSESDQIGIHLIFTQFDIDNHSANPSTDMPMVVAVVTAYNNAVLEWYDDTSVAFEYHGKVASRIPEVWLPASSFRSDYRNETSIGVQIPAEDLVDALFDSDGDIYLQVEGVDYILGPRSQRAIRSALKLM